MRFLILATLFNSLIAANVKTGSLYLPPLETIEKIGAEHCIVVIQGASIQTGRYIPLAEAIQRAVPVPVHVAIPEFYFDLPLPFIDIHDSILQASRNFPDGCPIVLVGHSVGAVSVQEEVKKHPQDYAATIILGASVFRDAYTNGFPTPILTLNGENDGLHRVSRVAEAFYNLFDRKQQSFAAGAPISPVIIVPGATHLQFSDGTEPPLVVKNMDLKPTVPTSEIHKIMAEIVSDFLVSAVHSVSRSGLATLEARMRTVRRLDSTRKFLDPMLKAMYQEAAPHLFRACNSDYLPAHCPFYPAWPVEVEEYPRVANETEDCICGTPWAQTAVEIMSGLDQALYPVINADAIHDVTDEKPFHHAHAWSNCTEANNAVLPCAMNHTTVSQQIYDKGDDMDTGFTHATAKELRLKMKSRQVFHLRSDNPDAIFKQYDVENGGNGICAKINEAAYQWALETASPSARARFEAHGMKMVMGEDYHAPLPIGPVWIYNTLSMKITKVKGGEKVMRIVSPSMRTPNEGFITTLYNDSNGYHYCKLLSPARVMEHIYTDGLRYKLGYN